MLKAIYGMRSELMLYPQASAKQYEQLDYNLLVRWLVGLNPHHRLWHPMMFVNNREWLLNEKLPVQFLELLMASLEVKPLMRAENY